LLTAVQFFGFEQTMELRVFTYGLMPGMYINQKCFLSDSSVGSTWSGLYQPKTKSRRQIELTHYGRCLSIGSFTC